MEDLWKDITFSTLTSSSSPPQHNDPSSSPTTIFQDFLIPLSRPFSSSSSKNIHLQSVPSSASNSLKSNLTLNNPHGFHHPNYNPFKNSTSSSSGSKHSCDTRHQRMINNRESAARSRARKQAYTNEMELEVAQLKQENARLRMEQEIREMKGVFLFSNLFFVSPTFKTLARMRNRAALNHQSSKKHKLHRTSTAPF